jgi:hypothetical protein
MPEVIIFCPSTGLAIKARFESRAQAYTFMRLNASQDPRRQVMYKDSSEEGGSPIPAADEQKEEEKVGSVKALAIVTAGQHRSPNFEWSQRYP